MIIYSGYYYSAKTYACTLAKMTGMKAISIQEYAKHPFPIHQLVLISSLYAGSFAHFSLLKKAFEKNSPDRITLIAIGLNDPNNENNQKNIRKAAGKLFGLKNYDLFYLPGCIDYSKLSFLHQIMMFGLKKSLEKKAARSKQDQRLLDTYGKKMDLMDLCYLDPIALFLNGSD